MNDELRNESQNESNARIIPPDNPHAIDTPAAPSSTLRSIFLGPDGLRAGWSILLFIALFALFVFASGFIAHRFDPHAAKAAAKGVIGIRFVLLNESIPFFGVVFATWILSKIERRPLSLYGFADRRKLPHLLAGLAWGVVFLSVLIFILHKSGLLVIDARLLFGSDVVRYGALWFVCFTFVALLEESLTRGYLQYTLTRGLGGLYKHLFRSGNSAALGFWTGAILLSFLFGLGHGNNAGESPIGLLTAGLAAIVFCFSLWRTGSLWWAIGFHASWDWAQSFLYGVADSGTIAQHRLLATHPVGRPVLSGGSTGPEGSIFVVVTLALIALIILFTLHPRNGYIAHLPSRLQDGRPQPNGIVS